MAPLKRILSEIRSRNLGNRVQRAWQMKRNRTGTQSRKTTDRKQTGMQSLKTADRKQTALRTKSDQTGMNRNEHEKVIGETVK